MAERKSRRSTRSSPRAYAGRDLQGPHGIPRKGRLNSRERWRRWWHGKSVDFVPDVEFGWWEECWETWQAQGLPGWVNNNHKGDVFFGLEQRQGLGGMDLGLRPGFTARMIEERGDKRVIQDGAGVLCELPKDGHSTIPHYLRFPIQTRADWQEFKKRLDPDDPFRVAGDIDRRVRQELRRDYPLCISCGSLFGYIRNWMGFENACAAVAEAPAFVEEMMEHLTVLYTTVIAKVLPKIQFDCASFWEDMAFNTGPMVSPRAFKQLMVPRYRRITDLLRKHGVDIAIVDCDGNVMELAPLWLEAGVNVMFPCEVQGGSDPVELRRRCGKDLLLLGGVNKHSLIHGRKAIDAELRRLAPLVEEGGFVPHVDHRCPPDVKYRDYLYYLSRKRKMFGIPE
jgi:uroporphyrinogen decarboxylase